MAVDLAVALADGATAISDLRALADQPALFGDVASVPTAWRTLDAVDAAALERIDGARAQARQRAWAAGMDPGFYVIDIDGTLVGAHSEKEGAAPNYKHGFGVRRGEASSVQRVRFPRRQGPASHREPSLCEAGGDERREA